MAISLSEILNKLNLKWEELTSEEKQTYGRWEKVLAGEITLEDIKNFIQGQVDQIEREWVNPDNSGQKDAVLKARLTNYKMLLAFLNGPTRAREYLENELKRTHNL